MAQLINADVFVVGGGPGFFTSPTPRLGGLE